MSTPQDVSSSSNQVKTARKYGIFIVSEGLHSFPRNLPTLAYLTRCLTTSKKEDEVDYLLEPLSNEQPNSMKELMQESNELVF